VGDVERPMQLKRWALMVMMMMMMMMMMFQGMEMPCIAYYPGKAGEEAESRQQKQEPTWQRQSRNHSSARFWFTRNRTLALSLLPSFRKTTENQENLHVVDEEEEEEEEEEEAIRG
jgi:hypothetical protein